MGLFSKSYQADHELLEIGRNIQKAYSDKTHKNFVVDKNKIILVIDSFFDLYNLIESKPDDNYYLGNLISTGKVEGTREEVLGNVSDAVGRTIKFIKESNEIYASQCEFYSRNFKVLLEKETLKKEPLTVLGSKMKDLENIALGNIT